MGVKVKVDSSRLKKFAEQLDELQGSARDQFFFHASREMAGRLIAIVQPRTPVGPGVKDENGKTIGQGGTLRRGWTGGMDAGTYASSLSVQRVGAGQYMVTVVNPVLYASYVEYGHRQTPGRYVPAIGKRLKASWVEGQFFLRTSENELRNEAPSMLRTMLDAYLRRVF